MVEPSATTSGDMPEGVTNAHKLGPCVPRCVPQDFDYLRSPKRPAATAAKLVGRDAPPLGDSSSLVM
jgi:hypothetical protein